MKEINDFCRAKHGRLSELADFLGVKPPSVSRYLSGTSTPDPEKVKLMTVWMEQEILKESERQSQLRETINGLRQRTNQIL